MTPQEYDWHNRACDSLRDLARIAIRQAIIAPLAQGLLGAGVFHEGGAVGAGVPSRAVSPMLFATAPRYHSGGIAGLMPDEVPAILQRGEIVIPKGGFRGEGRGSSDDQSPKPSTLQPITVNMTVMTRDVESFRQSRGQIMGDLAVSLARHKGRNT